MPPYRPITTWLVAIAWTATALITSWAHVHVHPHGDTAADVGGCCGHAAAEHAHHHHEHAGAACEEEHAHHHADEPASDHQSDGSTPNHEDCVICQFLATAVIPVALVELPELALLAPTTGEDCSPQCGAEQPASRFNRGPPAIV